MFAFVMLCTHIRFEQIFLEIAPKYFAALKRRAVIPKILYMVYLERFHQMTREHAKV